jgi:hypothetical protein
MKSLNLPIYDYKLKKSGANNFIFDLVRQKYVLLTPEEWVRQHFVHYLIEYLHYPKSLLSIERGGSYNSLGKRTDIRVYGSNGLPLMLVECKASTVPITAAVLNQALIYNRMLHAPYLVLTNGLAHYCWRVEVETGNQEVFNRIPDYGELVKK